MPSKLVTDLVRCFDICGSHRTDCSRRPHPAYRPFPYALHHRAPVRNSCIVMDPRAHGVRVRRAESNRRPYCYRERRLRRCRVLHGHQRRTWMCDEQDKRCDPHRPCRPNAVANAELRRCDTDDGLCGVRRWCHDHRPRQYYKTLLGVP